MMIPFHGETNPEAFIRYAEAEIRDARADVSLYVYDLIHKKTLLSYESEKRIVSASMIKVPVLLAALEQVRAGRLSLTMRVPVKRPLNDSKVFDHGEQSCTLGELLAWMIINSDNTAANVLIELLGMDAVNAWCSAAGLKVTVLERLMLDEDAVRAGRNNYTSAADQFLLFQSLYQQTILTPELCALAMDILRRQRDFSMAMRYLCAPDLIFAHKTGCLAHLRHDAGIFYARQFACFFGCFVSNVRDDTEAYAEKLIGRLAEAVYRYCGEAAI